MAYRDSSEIITRARYRLVDSGADMFDTTEMSSHLDSAVVEYSRYNPYMKTTTITAVIGQDYYSLPSDCIRLSRVYLTDSDSATSDTISDILTDIATHVYDYSEMQWRAQVRDRYSNYGQPLAVMWNNQLRLYPAPTSDAYTINVEYEAIHSKDESGNYTTIPFNDIDHVESLLVARCLEIVADDMAKRADYSEGQSKVAYSDSAKMLSAAAFRVRSSVKNALSEVVVCVA
jgi:hypothetical protein